jgi:hypothetical protein
MSSLADDFDQSASCVESNEPDTTAIHTTSLASGEVLYFQVVAQNPCGTGAAGNDSSGAARAVIDCL